jgi:antitoxin ParD1/3/4
MRAQKLSISLPKDQCDFIDHYQVERHCKNRSEVIQQALYLLQQQLLEACYLEANQEITDAFETTAFDGLDENETW